MAKAQVSPLKLLYMKARDTLTPESEILIAENDLTQNFIDELVWRIKNGQLINIQVRGQVRSGKSTAGITMMWWINDFLIQEGLTENTDMYHLIMADQTEFLRFIRAGEENVCILIDEYNKMSESGANAMTELNLFQHYSNVFAAKYNHRVSCSPTGTIDHLSDIYLDFIGRGTDESGKYTRFKLIFKDPTDRFGQNMKLLGWVDIPVDKTMESDFYQKYLDKKFKRLRLLEQYGIINERPMEMADYVLMIFNDLKIQAELEKVPVSSIKASLEVFKLDLKTQQMFSILYDNEIIQRVQPMLDLVYLIHKVSRKVQRESTKESADQVILSKYTNLETMFRGKLASLIQNQKKLIEIQKEYRRIN